VGGSVVERAGGTVVERAGGTVVERAAPPPPPPPPPLPPPPLPPPLQHDDEHKGGSITYVHILLEEQALEEGIGRRQVAGFVATHDRPV